MMIYKCVQNGFILGIGESESLDIGEIEITEEEYNQILTAIKNKPYIDTDTKKYYLAENFEWVEVENEISKQGVSDIEALSIIMGVES